MAFQETELHKLHLRLEALEGKKELPAHLAPSGKVLTSSDVKLPEDASVTTGEPLAADDREIVPTEDYRQVHHGDKEFEPNAPDGVVGHDENGQPIVYKPEGATVVSEDVEPLEHEPTKVVEPYRVPNAGEEVKG